MKKFLLVVGCCLWSLNASAQMNDMLGALMVQGTLTSGSAANVGKMQNALARANFQQDLAILRSTIQIHYMGNYRGLDKSGLSFDGFQGMEWNVGSETGNDYFIEVSGLDGATCFLCKGRSIQANRVEINNGGDCQSDNNHVKMFF